MIKSKSKTTEKGKGFLKKLEAAAKETAGASVTVGVHKGEGKYSDQVGANGKPGPPVDVALVALWNEFGTVNAPERSFLRSAVNENEHLIAQWRLEMLQNIVAGKMTVAKALEAMGFRIKELVVAKIKSNVPPPNAPSTTQRKKDQGIADRTLIETTLLMRSIKYKVTVPAGGKATPPPEGHGH